MIIKYLKSLFCGPEKSEVKTSESNMLYKDLINLTTFGSDLVEYVKTSNDKINKFNAILYLIHIEQIFDQNRDLFSDQKGFDLTGDEVSSTRRNITVSMDNIRGEIKKLIDSFGREQFKEQYEEMMRMRQGLWL